MRRFLPRPPPPRGDEGVILDPLLGAAALGFLPLVPPLPLPPPLLLLLAEGDGAAKEDAPPPALLPRLVALPEMTRMNHVRLPGNALPLSLKYKTLSSD